MKSFKKHIVFVFIFVLVIPLLVQTIHAFEHHEQTICQSLNEHHIHKLDLDCSQLHLPFETFSTQISFTHNIILQHFYHKKFNKQPKNITVVYIAKKSSRAPPHLTV